MVRSGLYSVNSCNLQIEEEGKENGSYRKKTVNNERFSHRWQLKPNCGSWQYAKVGGRMKNEQAPKDISLRMCKVTGNKILSLQPSQ